MDFKQLQSFVTVVKHQNFTKAADSLQISQPTISTHVRMLEEELGVPLVIRTAKRVELTPAGRKMYEQALMVLAMRDRMIEATTMRENDTIYIGASSIPSGYVLPDALSEFSENHPDVKFVISQGDSQSVVSDLLDGVFDIGLVGMQADENALTCIPFCSDRMVLAAPATERFKAIDPTNEQAVRNIITSERMIMRREGSASRAMANGILEALGIPEDDVQVAARIGDQEAIKNLVESGFGVTIISEKAVRDRLEQGRLVVFDLPEEVAARKLFIVYRRNVELDDCVSELVLLLRFKYGVDQ